jgi:NADPH-dependent curcumin reductase CurA
MSYYPATIRQQSSLTETFNTQETPMPVTSTQVQLAARPVGDPKHSDFKITKVELPAVGVDEMLCRIIYQSLDPYMRGRMDDTKSYAVPVQIGDVLGAGTVAEVIESKNAKFKPGDIVTGMFGWQTYIISNGVGIRKIDPGVAPISTAVGILGMPGMTAYVGLLDIGEPKKGETVVVAAASGAVGSAVGQIAKIKGCRVIGIAGAAEKCAYVTEELGFDACLSHHSNNLDAELAALCPDGIDVYFENVGGKVFDAVFPLLNPFARIPICGLISRYSHIGEYPGPNELPKLMRSILTNRLKIQGFIITERWNRFQDFEKDVSGWIKSGALKYREDFVDGLENAPEAFMGLLKGKNFGKLLVRVSEDPTA